MSLSFNIIVKEARAQGFRVHEGKAQWRFTLPLCSRSIILTDYAGMIRIGITCARTRGQRKPEADEPCGGIRTLEQALEMVRALKRQYEALKD